MERRTSISLLAAVLIAAMTAVAGTMLWSWLHPPKPCPSAVQICARFCAKMLPAPMPARCTVPSEPCTCEPPLHWPGRRRGR